MVYVVDCPPIKPYVQIGELPGYDHKMPDLEKRVAISDIYKYGIDRQGNRVLDPGETPGLLVIQKPRKARPPVFVSVDGMMLVNEEVRRIIERHDSDSHQFLSIKVQLGKKSRENLEYYILNVYCRQSSIVDEKSSVESHSSNPDVMYVRDPANVFFESKIARDHNIWREDRYPGGLFISDELFSSLASANIRFLKTYRGYSAGS